MNTTGLDTGFATLWGIHVLSVVLFFVGIILLIHWAMKTLNQGQLKKWGIILAIVGALLCIATIGAKGSTWGGYGAIKCGSMQMMDNNRAGHMMGDGMMHGGDDHMSMSMDEMSEVLEGLSDDAFDQAFIEMMIPHHQGAIDMARAAQKSAKHQEIKDMADDIISAQQSEIDMMQQWLKDWGYNE